MKVLIAASCSDNFDAAIDYLKNNSWNLNSVFKLVHVIEPSDVNDLWLSLSGATRFRQILAERQLEAESQSAETEAKCLDAIGNNDTRLDTDILIGVIDEVVLKTAQDWEADVVIIGLPESTFIGRCIEGNFLSRVVADAPCPVLFTRKQKDNSVKASA